MVMSDTSSTAGGAVELMLTRQELYSYQIDKYMPYNDIKSTLSLSFYHLFTLTVCLNFASLSSLFDYVDTQTGPAQDITAFIKNH